MSTISEALKNYISEQDKQIALSSRWLELWQQRYPKRRSWSPQTVESNLSRLLKDEPQGIKWFFGEPDRAELLLEVLGVPEPGRAHIWAHAGKQQQPNPRVVIDVTAWSANAELLLPLFAELRQKALRDTRLQPVALVLTEQQFDCLPRSYDEQLAQRTVVPHKLEDPAEGPALVAELAGDTALVISPREFAPMNRWLAVEYKAGALVFEPTDGLADFAETGGLPPLPQVEHPLENICEPSRMSFREFTPLEKRKWCHWLADEATTLKLLEDQEALRLPANRLALARKLGVTATSTEAERREHELAGLMAELQAELGVQVDRLDASAHQECLSRAALRPSPGAAWRYEDELHLLNLDTAITHPRLIVHRPVPPTPALTRLWQHITGWTDDDHEADPTLARAVEVLDPDGAERLAFLHARATILWNDLRPALRPVPQTEHWAERLRALLAGDPPPASLRLHLPPPDAGWKPALGRDHLAFKDDRRLIAAHEIDDALLVLPPGRRTIMTTRGREVVLHHERTGRRRFQIETEAEGRVLLAGLSGYRGPTLYADPDDAHQYDTSLNSIPRTWIPSLAVGVDVNLWLDCFERTATLGPWAWEHSPRCEKLLRTTGAASVELVELAELTVHPVTIASATWTAADLLLAQCWLALRVALERPLALRLDSGVVCSLGGGVCAHIVALERDGDSADGVVAGFDATVAKGAAELDFEALWTHSAIVDHHIANFGVRVPRRLVLRAPGLAATVTFLASPLLQATAPALGSMAAMVAARIAEDEQAEQAAYDDD